MKRSIIIAGAIVLAVAGMAGAAGLAPARVQASQAAPEEVATVLNTACATCHDLTAVQPGLYTMAEWQETIDRMVGYGAAVTEEENQLILNYLGTDGAGADGGGAGEFDPDAAMAVLNTACSTCHDLTAVQPGIYTMEEWRATVDRMVGYGASISEEDTELILNYLGTDGAGAGGGEESSEEAAIAILNTACATCHDLAAVQPGIYTGAEWTEVITRMRGYGAVISDEDANTILSYLATDWQQ